VSAGTRTKCELVLLPRVAFRGREITGSRLHGLPALLAPTCGPAAAPRAWWTGSGRRPAPSTPTKALQVLVSTGAGALTDLERLAAERPRDEEVPAELLCGESPPAALVGSRRGRAVRADPSNALRDPTDPTLRPAVRDAYFSSADIGHTGGRDHDLRDYGSTPTAPASPPGQVDPPVLPIKVSPRSAGTRGGLGARAGLRLRRPRRPVRAGAEVGAVATLDPSIFSFHG